ncbi:hypothetical protein DL765_001196 [Monosporascus sp. GIB2]|nr:hypothetical protein DL765_001196 [Monosporascus sp. GIB2]
MTDKEEAKTPGMGTDDLEDEGDQEFINYLSSYATAMIFVSALGSQITFSIIVSDIADPKSIVPWQQGELRRGAIFSLEKVRALVALSWLFFLMTLGIAATTQALLLHPTIKDSVLKRRKDALKLNNRHWFTLLSIAGFFFASHLPIAAFLLLSLAVTSYVPTAGWIAVCGSTGLGIFSIALFAAQARKDWEKRNRPQPPR